MNTNWSSLSTNESITEFLVSPFMNHLNEANLEVDYMEYTNSSNQTLMCPSLDMPRVNYMVMLLYAVVCIVGLTGNSLVIYVVLRFSKMKTVTNMYILNLAIADEAFLIGMPFLIITMHLRQWHFGAFMCKAYMVSQSITQFTSSIFLLVMSADRYIAICCHVESSRLRTPLVSKIVSAIAWTASAIIMLPIIIYANTITLKDGKHSSCIIQWPDYGHNMPDYSFILYTLILGFVIPLIFIITFYFLVLKKLRNVGPKATKSRSRRKSHRKVTKLVLTVVTVYIMCWLPYWVSQVALISSSPETCNTRLGLTIFLLVGCLGYSNSAINPILYAYLSDNFKKSFLKACKCAMGREGQDFGSSGLPKKLKKNHQKKENNTQFTNTTTIIVTNTKNNKNKTVNPSINNKLLFIDPATNTTSINTSTDNIRNNQTQHISDGDFGTDINNTAITHPTTSISDVGSCDNRIQTNVIVNNCNYSDIDLVELT